MTTYTATIGTENATWITTDTEMRAMLHGEVTDLGDGRIRLTTDGHAILSRLDAEREDGAIENGLIWIEGDGYPVVADH